MKRSGGESECDAASHRTSGGAGEAGDGERMPGKAGGEENAKDLVEMGRGFAFAEKREQMRAQRWELFRGAFQHRGSCFLYLHGVPKLRPSGGYFFTYRTLSYCLL